MALDTVMVDGRERMKMNVILCASNCQRLYLVGTSSSTHIGPQF